VSSVADAYSAGATAWAEGPAHIYARLAEELVAFSPSVLSGAAVLDLGSGTGAGSIAASAVGAQVIAVDISFDMLMVNRAHRPPGAVMDAAALAFRSHAFDVVLAPFSLNHFVDPTTVMQEARRVAPLLLASTYANDDDHPAKHAADDALREHGWQAPDWYTRFKGSMRSWGTVEGAQRLVRHAGLDALKVERHDVAFTGMSPSDLVAWRLGMAHTAPYLAGLDTAEQSEVTARALELLGPHPEPLVRRLVFVAAT
jgi:SAM-dependent methyltransferase